MEKSWSAGNLFVSGRAIRAAGSAGRLPGCPAFAANLPSGRSALPMLAQEHGQRDNATLERTPCAG
jgi:hypothetical protein